MATVTQVPMGDPSPEGLVQPLDPPTPAGFYRPYVGAALEPKVDIEDPPNMPVVGPTDGPFTAGVAPPGGQPLTADQANTLNIIHGYAVG